MEMGNGDLLKAQAHIRNQAFNFMKSASLKCAVQLGIPDIIHSHGKPMSFPLLIAALPINPTKARFVFGLMRVLVHSGIFNLQKISNVSASNQEQPVTSSNEADEDDFGYSLTPASRLLLKDWPLNERAFVLLQSDPVLQQPWYHLSDWLLNDDACAFHTAYGRTLWDYCAEDPRLECLFNETMVGDCKIIIKVLLDDCKNVFDGLTSLVDVGGGSGTVSKAIAEALPNLNCTVLDLPRVIAGQKGTENLEFVGGDMFKAIPPANAIVLKSILHNWKDEECVEILKKCKEAIPSKEEGGKVILIDTVIENQKQDDDDETYETQLFFDMLMMVVVAGKERSEKEWKKLFADAGFSGYKIISGFGSRSLIEIYP